MVDVLLDQHSAIIETALTLRDAVRREPRAPLDEVVRLHIRLCELVKAHQRDEERIVYTPLLQHGGIIRMPRLRRALQQIQQEKSRFCEASRRWTPEAIRADRQGHAAAVEVICQILVSLSHAEEEELFPHLKTLATAA